MKKIISLFVLVLFVLGSCSAPKTRYEAEFLDLFDTLTKIVAYSEDKQVFTIHAEFIKAELSIYHKLYDIYNDYESINNIKTINDNAGVSPVVVDEKIIELILYSKEQYNETGGAVNIALGPVLKVWHNYRTEGIENPENAKLPSKSELEAANKLTDINKIIIDKEKKTVFLTEKGMSLDVGAIAKGFATEAVCESARQKGFTAGLLSVGGNVKAIGTKKDEKLWNLGIQNPSKPEELLNVLYLSEKSLVTSGDYQRYYTVDGVKYHHIINPKTLFPAEYFKSVTIITENSAQADALSTALFTLPLEEGKKLIEAQNETYAIWVLKDGSTVYSSGTDKFLTE